MEQDYKYYSQLRYALSMEVKMAAGKFGRATNYGWHDPFKTKRIKIHFFCLRRMKSSSPVERYYCSFWKQKEQYFRVSSGWGFESNQRHDRQVNDFVVKHGFCEFSFRQCGVRDKYVLSVDFLETVVFCQGFASHIYKKDEEGNDKAFGQNGLHLNSQNPFNLPYCLHKTTSNLPLYLS